MKVLAVLPQDQLHFSYSQLRTYLICPAKYEHHYIRQTPQSHRSPNLIFGSAIHSTLAEFYLRLKNTDEKMAAEEMIELFTEDWKLNLDGDVPVRFAEPDDDGKLIDLAAGLLDKFCELPQPDKVIAVEQAFSVDLVNPITGEVMDMKLAGFIDLIVERDNRPLIVEHKTAARKYSADQLNYDAQPSLYSYAAEQLGLHDPRLEYQLFLKTKTPAIASYEITRSNSQVNEALETSCQILRAIESGAFYRQRSWACADCQYSHAC